jgi:hypothetical protein
VCTAAHCSALLAASKLFSSCSDSAIAALHRMPSTLDFVRRRRFAKGGRLDCERKSDPLVVGLMRAANSVAPRLFAALALQKPVFDAEDGGAAAADEVAEGVEDLSRTRPNNTLSGPARCC